MDIIVNGKPHKTNEKCTISQLLADLGMHTTHIAVEVNMTVVSRSQHSQFVLSQHDRVEIIQAVGGG